LPSNVQKKLVVNILIKCTYLPAPARNVTDGLDYVGSSLLLFNGRLRVRVAAYAAAVDNDEKLR
jgi:hypothetical protein